jgi:PqqD family protein of HPr-rel-A system
MLRAMGPPTYIADTDGLKQVELEGLGVLFHPRSGMTHILAPPSPQILDVLRQGPADAQEVTARLRGRFDFPEAGGAAAVEARLAELEASGLVRRA